MSMFEKMLAEHLIAGKLMEISTLIHDVERIAKEKNVAIDFSAHVKVVPAPEVVGVVETVVVEETWESSDWESSDEGWESSSC